MSGDKRALRPSLTGHRTIRRIRWYGPGAERTTPRRLVGHDGAQRNAPLLFNVRDQDDVALDPEGTELADLQAARREAIESAKESWSDLLKSGINPLRRVFEISDGSGQIVLTVPYSEAMVAPRR